MRQEAPPPPPVQLEPEPVPQPEETFIPPPPPPQAKSEPVPVPDKTGWEEENVYEVPPVDKVNITDDCNYDYDCIIKEPEVAAPGLYEVPPETDEPGMYAVPPSEEYAPPPPAAPVSTAAPANDVSVL